MAHPENAGRSPRGASDIPERPRPRGATGRREITLGEYLEGTWLPYIESERRSQTAAGYRKMVTNYIGPAIGGLRLRDVDKDALRRLYASCPTDVLRSYCHRVLSSAFGYAVKDLHLIAANPCAAIRPPRNETPEAKHLDVDEAQRLLREVRGHDLEGAVLLGLVGGLRVGEACAIRWRDVDLSTGSLIVAGSYWGPTKSGKPRGLTLPVFAVASLRRYRKDQAERLLAVGVRQDDDTYLVTDGLGDQMRPQRLSGAFQRFSEAHGFDLPRFHGLRHTAAVSMLSAGVDIKTAASRLGHANPGLLFSTYGHYVRSADQAAADHLDGFLGG